MTNVERMSNEARAGNVALRPHVKSHKSAYIAQRQLEAGAHGISCAKMGEAESIVARVGRNSPLSVLLTSPLVGRPLAERAIALAKHCDLIVVVDHPDGVRELTDAIEGNHVTLSVLCDVDVGVGRTGVTTPANAVALANLVAESHGLRFTGVQGYAGNLQHRVGREHRRAANIESMTRLRDVITALESAGHEVALRTGGGTGTSSLDLEHGVLNELQPGSYVFMDRQYRDALGDDREGRFEQSLTLLTTVVSANHDGYVTVDAGLKAMATDAGMPVVVGHELATYAFIGDEHGLVSSGDGPPFRRGERLELVPPHCDPTVDKYDVIWLVYDDVVVDVIEVTARGRSQ